MDKRLSCPIDDLNLLKRVLYSLTDKLLTTPISLVDPSGIAFVIEGNLYMWKVYNLIGRYVINKNSHEMHP